MCGFVAHIAMNGPPIDSMQLEAMAEDLAHRGPDESSHFITSWAGLAFRRLAIQDLSERSSQPMISGDSRYALVFNGEIYNQTRLRDELTAHGITFRSSGDTEVLMEAYRVWGRDCLHRIEGMFAFVILDLEAKTAFAARDPLGIKPIYLARRPEGIFLASEIKAFRHVMPFLRNDETLYEQLAFRYVSGATTPFKGIERLLGGEWLMIKNHHSWQRHRYYQVSRTLKAPRQAWSESDIADALSKSFHTHTLSDVGYVVQLSGGIDSSYLACVLASDHAEHFRTFSASLPGSVFDEQPYQEQAAALCRSDHQSIIIDAEDFADHFERFTWHMDLPIIHMGCVVLMRICDHAQEYSKVIITGEGADECFGGYDWLRPHWKYDLAEILHDCGFPSVVLPRRGKLGVLRSMIQTAPWERGQGSISRMQMKMIAPGLTPSAPYRTEIAQQFRQLSQRRFALAQECYLPSVLERQDRASMAASVEARVPYCLPVLFARANAMPSACKITAHATKIALKKLAGRFFNTSFLDRRKNGLALPLADWLRQPRAMGRFLDLVTDKTFRERDFLNASMIEKMVTAHRLGEADHTRILTRLIAFEVWHRRFLDEPVTPP